MHLHPLFQAHQVASKMPLMCKDIWHSIQASWGIHKVQMVFLNSMPIYGVKQMVASQKHGAVYNKVPSTRRAHDETALPAQFSASHVYSPSSSRYASAIASVATLPSYVSFMPCVQAERQGHEQRSAAYSPNEREQWSNAGQQSANSYPALCLMHSS